MNNEIINIVECIIIDLKSKYKNVNFMYKYDEESNHYYVYHDRKFLDFDLLFKRLAIESINKYCTNKELNDLILICYNSEFKLKK